MNKIVFLLLAATLICVAPGAHAQRPSLVTPLEASHLVASNLVWPASLNGPRDTVARKLWLPRGFTAEVFATGFPWPQGAWLRMMATDSAGVVHVTDMDAGRVFALPDRDKNGVADTVLTARAGVGKSNSIAFYKGFLYIAETDSVHKFSDEDFDGYYETEHECVSDLHTGGPFDHWTRTVIIDPAREKLLVSVGTSCNACRQADEYRSVILEYNLDGTGRRIYATGLRNALGLAIEPKTGTLWTTNADRNKMGDDLPEEIITRVRDGGFYGWPYAYGNKEWVDFSIDSEYASILPLTKADTERVANMEVADLFIPAHATPAGIHFYQGSMFPEQYRSGYVCVRGSAESSKPVGYKVMRFWQDAGMQWRLEDFCAGFLTDSNEYNFWGRPHGMTEGRDGALYFTAEGNPRMVLRIAFDPTKNVERATQAKPQIKLILANDASYWLETSSFENQPASLRLESYTIAGHLIARRHVQAEPTETGIKISLSELPTGPQLIVLSSESERISSIITIPK
jgi:glucose/arabinose dehydrogenase